MHKLLSYKIEIHFDIVHYAFRVGFKLLEVLPLLQFLVLALYDFLLNEIRVTSSQIHQYFR